MIALAFITNYLKRLAGDDRLKPIHISLAMALCQNWTENHFVASFRASRRLLMSASHIMSKATYHKALRELQAFGYVSYEPSYHPRKASRITIVNKPGITRFRTTIEAKAPARREGTKMQCTEHKEDAFLRSQGGKQGIGHSGLGAQTNLKAPQNLIK